MQCSDWGIRPLARSQIQYAAIDALVLTRIFDSLLSHSELAVIVPTNGIITSLCKKYAVLPPQDKVVREIRTFDGYTERVDQQQDNTHVSLKSMRMHEFPMPRDWQL